MGRPQIDRGRTARDKAAIDRWPRVCYSGGIEVTKLSLFRPGTVRQQQR